MREELHERLLLALLGEASFENLGQLSDPDVFPEEYSLIPMFVLGGRPDPEYFNGHRDEKKNGARSRTFTVFMSLKYPRAVDLKV